MDAYQAIYDAVRSRISGCNVDSAISDAIGSAFSMAQHHIACAMQDVSCAFANTAEALRKPSAVYRPRISIDGNQWCALYGENLQDGVAGFGDSPALAMADFDSNWNLSLPKVTT